MKKIYTLMIGLLVVGSSFAQKTAVIKQTSTPIVIDGVIEGTWANADVNVMDVVFQTETPTVTPTWQALWDNDNFYIVVNVQDDSHFVGSPDYQFDKVEVYFDVNATLADGKGPATTATGHYQWAPGFGGGFYGAGAQTTAGDTRTPKGTYAYERTDENYVYEFAASWSGFFDVDNNPVDAAVAQTRPMGFDVCIVDQDKDITTARQRMLWSQDGKTNVLDEAWNNMDDAGQITFKPGVGVKTMKNITMSVYPNPTVGNLTINANFNKVVISNILGQEVKTIASKSKTINVSDLAKGVYVIKAYNGSNFAGMSKFTKN
jgi:hypothetical protein